MEKNLNIKFNEKFAEISFLRLLVLFICFSYSIYLLLTLGAITQAYISSFGVYSCDNCFTEIENFTKIIATKPDMYYLLMAMIIFITSLYYTERMKILISTWISTTIIITTHDIIFAKNEVKIIPYAIENLMFNSFGGILLSIFILFNLASINYLLLNKKSNLLVASIIPLASSFLISFMIYGYLYLIYERAPAHIDALFSEKLSGTLQSSDKDESFGFLTTPKKIEKEFSVQSFFNNEFSWKSGTQKFDMKAYFFSGCILNIPGFEKYKSKPNAIIEDISNLKFSTKKPVIYFAKGDELSASIDNVKEINNSGGEYTTSQMADGIVKLKSTYTPFILLINIASFDKNSITKETEYTLSINGKDLTIKNNISTYNIDQQNSLKCQQISSKNNTIPNNNNIIGVTSFALEFIPKGAVNLPKDSMVTINVEKGNFIKAKNSKEPLKDFTNGYLKHINLFGLEELKINNKKIDVSDSDLLYATGDNLIGFITKNNKVKVFGTAEKVALNTKVMNLKPISILNNKLSYLNTSIADIFKVIFGMGFVIFSTSYFIKFFKRKNTINVLSKK